MAIPELFHPETRQEKPSINFGSYTPQRVLTNQEIESWGVKTAKGQLLTADAILKKTGIEKRYVANSQENPLFMATKAAEKALEETTDKIDAVIVSTSFPTGENISGKLQERFGISGFHMDIHAACSGVGVSLAYLKKYERRFAGARVLFATTEKYSPFLQDLRNGGSLKDPSLAQTLFSDGAYACTFEYGKDLKVLSVKKQVFPEARDLIRMPINENLFVDPYFAIPIPYPQSGKFEQEGSKVYKLVRKNVPDLIRQSVREAGLAPSDIKMLFVHQGSGHMVTGIVDQLPELKNNIWIDYQDGNHSSASTPKGVMRAKGEDKIKKNDIVNLTVFGAGMLAISTTLRF